LAVFAFALLFVHGTSAGTGEVKLNVEPHEVLIDLFYQGADVRITGEAPGGRDLAIICAGAETKAELKQKAKVWGVLWLSVSDVTFEHVPGFYSVASTRKLDDCASDDALAQAGLGYPALMEKAVPDADLRRQEMFLKTEGGPVSRFSASVRLPARAGEGEYRVRLVSLSGGKVEPLADAVFAVKLVGGAAFIKSFSVMHGLWYGIFAVVIALTAGLLSGIVFGRGGHKRGH
jgi:hypothetical protein